VATSTKITKKRSSRFTSVCYNTEESALTVVFRHGKVTGYHYHGVPAFVYAEFLSAESMGRYYDDFIQGRYLNE